MSEREIHEKYESLRKPLDEATREQINEALQQNPDVSTEALISTFGEGAVEAYWSNPDAGGNA